MTIMKDKTSKMTNLEVIYQIKPELIYQVKEGKVVITKPQNHWIQRVFRKLYVKIPNQTSITLDEYGSFIFQAIDGKKTVEEIGSQLVTRHEEAQNHLFERLDLYLNYLEVEAKWIMAV